MSYLSSESMVGLNAVEIFRFLNMPSLDCKSLHKVRDLACCVQYVPTVGKG